MEEETLYIKHELSPIYTYKLLLLFTGIFKLHFN